MYIYIYISLNLFLSFISSWQRSQSGDQKLKIKYFDQKNAVFTVSKILELLPPKHNTIKDTGGVACQLYLQYIPLNHNDSHLLLESFLHLINRYPHQWFCVDKSRPCPQNYHPDEGTRPESQKIGSRAVVLWTTFKMFQATVGSSHVWQFFIIWKLSQPLYKINNLSPGPGMCFNPFFSIIFSFSNFPCLSTTDQ